MSNSEMCRLAILGCGRFAEQAVIPALRRVGWSPSVLVDTSLHQLEVVARKIGRKGDVTKSSDWRSVVSQFDAAIVALPSSQLRSVSIALIEAGKHVLVDVPGAISGDESQAIIAAAGRSRVVWMLNRPRRHLHVACWTKALFGAHALGEIEHLDVREGVAANSDVRSGLALPQFAPDAGVLIDVGRHALDLVQWWFGDLEPVDYCDDSEGGIAADCVLKCRLSSGAAGRIEFSRTRRMPNSVRIEGTRGFVEVHLHKNEVIAGSPDALAFKYEGMSAGDMKPQLASELFASEVAEFRRRIRDNDCSNSADHVAPSQARLIEWCLANRNHLQQPWEAAPIAPSSEPADALPRLPPGSKVLVTGAGGFIGGRLIERLVREQGASIRGIIRDIDRAARVGRLPVELLAVDLTDSREIHRAVDGVEYVFHCAYDSGSRRQNIEGLRNIINACRAHAVRRLVHVSTFAVYEPFPDGPLTEETPDGDRTNVYVDTKLDLEAMILEAVHKDGIAAAIVQPAIVYGPFCRPWTNTPAEMLTSGDVILPDRGEGLCNAVYIDDLVDGLILAAVSAAAIGQRFIISGPEPVTWATFFREMARALEATPPQFWPRERILEKTRGAIGHPSSSWKNPKRLIKIALRSPVVRSVLQSALELLPVQWRTFLVSYHFNSGRQQGREVLLPNNQMLALYLSKAIAGSEKARSKLGYRPRFDFERGMAVTGRYLKWAYRDDTCS